MSAKICKYFTEHNLGRVSHLANVLAKEFRRL